jgi:hypothetical protein
VNKIKIVAIGVITGVLVGTHERNWAHALTFKHSFPLVANEDDGCQFVEEAVTAVHFQSVRVLNNPRRCGVSAENWSATRRGDGREVVEFQSHFSTETYLRKKNNSLFAEQLEFVDIDCFSIFKL